MVQLYRYDFSDVRGYELSEHGTFVYRFLDHYWSERGRHAFFIRVDGRLGGFALAREVDGEHEVAEFFVARRHRRAGVGRQAARLLFGRLPGHWSLFHDDANEPAARFWGQVVPEASGGRFECEEVITSAGFAGRRYRFSLLGRSVVGSVEAMSDPVEVVDHDPRCPAMFAAEAARFMGALAGEVMAVEHVGSTAAEGLAAKPVIDIQVGVRTLEATPQIVAALVGLGYEYVPEYEEVFPRRRYFRKTAAGRRTHQVHLVERADRAWWDRHVAFRGWLGGHPDDRDAYAALKLALAARYRDNREAYTEARGEFVARILARAAAGEDP
ncbi:MAG TPA: GNAT family N-acetyltransferase [Acidimicrobiales bacterium]|nr:GNAT family N-acetyltransferase [Acidimicrobiales bacterium]